MAAAETRLVVVGLEVFAPVALDPVQAEVVGVREVDRAVRVQAALPERVERQRRLVRAALRVEVDVRVRVVRPARRHLLRAGRDAVVALDLALARDRAVLDRIRAEVEVVERAEALEEQLRSADKRLRPRLDGDPRLRPVAVVEPRPAYARLGLRRTRRHGIATP